MENFLWVDGETLSNVFVGSEESFVQPGVRNLRILPFREATLIRLRKQEILKKIYGHGPAFAALTLTSALYNWIICTSQMVCSWNGSTRY